MMAQRGHQGRLANASLAIDQDHLSKAFFALFPTPQEQPDFLISSHLEGDRNSSGLVLGFLQEPMHPEHGHGSGHAFQHLRPQGLQMKRAFHQPGSHLADEHGIRRR
jgi:hypothetical protein